MGMGMGRRMRMRGMGMRGMEGNGNLKWYRCLLNPNTILVAYFLRRVIIVFSYKVLGNWIRFLRFYFWLKF
jgi:hypothetical protein